MIAYTRERRAAMILTIEAIRERARRKLSEFVRYTKEDYIDGWFQKKVCEELDWFLTEVSAQRSPRMMIFSPRRHGKSELVSRRLPAFALGNYPDMKIIAASYGDTLASEMNRDVQRIIDDVNYTELFPGTRLVGMGARDTNAVRTSSLFTVVGHEGSYTSSGVGGGLTGRGSNLLLLDDPFKDAAEAYSDTVRRTTWEWFQHVFYTCCEPGGGILICNCLVGDTKVLLADGSETPIRDIRPGDIVATYEDGYLHGAVVKNWANQGCDNVFAISMTSGRVVKANERHPFLVNADGELRWVRLRNLKPGDKIVSLGCECAHSMGAIDQHMLGENVTGTTMESSESIQLGTMASGAVLSARSKSVECRFPAKVFASLIMQELVGQLVTIGARMRMIAVHIFDTGTGLILRSMAFCSNNRAVGVLFADDCLQKRTHDQAQDSTFASTMITRPVRQEGCSATTVTSELADSELLRHSMQLLSTYEITVDEISCIEPDGYEDVFDIQVDRTENFIANGLVSHNTRWHEDDLSGKLLSNMAKGGEPWKVLSFPAIAEEDEEFRKKGEPLFPERYDLEALNRIKAGTEDEVGLGSRMWNAMYQQRPTAREGEIFKRDNWDMIRCTEDLDSMDSSARRSWMRQNLGVEKLIQCWDTAIGAKKKNDFAACVTLGVTKTRYITLEVWKGRLKYPQVRAEIENRYAKWKPDVVGVEGGGSASGKAAVQDLEAISRLPLKEIITAKDKELRADLLSPTHEAGRCALLQGASWVSDFIGQCAGFPNIKNDDDVDAWMLAMEEAVHGQSKMGISSKTLTAFGVR